MIIHLGCLPGFSPQTNAPLCVFYVFLKDSLPISRILCKKLNQGVYHNVLWCLSSWLGLEFQKVRDCVIGLCLFIQFIAPEPSIAKRGKILNKYLLNDPAGAVPSVIFPFSLLLLMADQRKWPSRGSSKYTQFRFQICEKHLYTLPQTILSSLL